MELVLCRLGKKVHVSTLERTDEGDDAAHLPDAGRELHLVGQHTPRIRRPHLVGRGDCDEAELVCNGEVERYRVLAVDKARDKASEDGRSHIVRMTFEMRCQIEREPLVVGPVGKRLCSQDAGNDAGRARSQAA